MEKQRPCPQRYKGGIKNQDWVAFEERKKNQEPKVVLETAEKSGTHRGSDCTHPFGESDSPVRGFGENEKEKEKRERVRE